MTLAAWSSGHESLGYPVVRGRRQERLDLTVPQCRSCARRGRTLGWLAVGGAVAGIAIAGVASDWHGGSAFLGFFLGSLAVALAGLVYEKRAGRRIVTDYPPLRYLLRHGWHYQGSA